MVDRGENFAEREARLERDTVERISTACAFAGRVSDPTHDAPDILCVQGGAYPKTRLIEVTYDGYLTEAEQRDLVEIAGHAPDFVQMEAVFRPSPRKKKKRKLHKPGQDSEKTRKILEDEFSQSQLER